MFKSYKVLKTNFPTPPDTNDNSWLHQNVFYNNNFSRKYPNNNKTTFLTPTFFGLADTHHKLQVIDFYAHNTFITHNELNSLTNTNIHALQYSNLKFQITSKIGHQKKYEALPKPTLPQKKFTHSNIESLMQHTKKGSRVYREIIGRRNKPTDIHNPKRWILKLNDIQITRKHVRTAMINLNSKYIDVPTSDIINRLKLGKTQFNNSLYSYNQIDTPYCNTCTREHNEEHTEDYLHTNFTCTSTQSVISEVSHYFFPHPETPFNKRDILLATLTDKHSLYKGRIGHELTDVIWNYYTSYIINSKQSNTTPLPSECIFLIKSQINRILKILPLSNVATFIKNQPTLLHIYTT